MNSTETTATTTTTNYYEQREQEHDLESTAVRNRLVKNSSTSPKVTLWTDILINAGFIASWYLFATLISLYNKWMFSPDHYNFQYPLFVSACHMYIQFGLAAATLALFPSIRSRTRPTPHDYLKKALPCGMASGLDIGLSNTSLKTVTLSFYTMCKSSSLAFVLLFAFLFKLEKPTYKLSIIILIITAGVILMVSSETQFDLWGMIEVLTASCLGGLRWSLTQILLDKQSMGMNTPIATIFWLAPTMGISLSFCSLIFEGWNNLLNEHAFFGDLGKSFTTMTYISTAGILAYLMTVSEYFLIQRTSVVTLSIAGVFKEVGTIFLSTIIFHDVMTPLNISGLGITLFGIVLYNVLKYKQSLKKTNLSDGRDREGLIVLTNRTKENSQIYSKLEDEDDNENEDEDEQDQDQEGRQQLNQTHHALHSNIDDDLESELVRNDSLDENIDPRRRLMLMTERVSSTTRL
ncbi:hypothetical protein Pst134EA_013544 [Puccinia striiformis f. sp. tritici]|uniref:hypothetical protein n=1 Tax=Puccinia striiformis f. sp. tritici TaxID=168172 RepID=UPI0020074519|nr:hypothetical protein Pst134EA_013544 [Puccinia striiformis f. sp. tritici]KAH9465661.1 hypothetical protein Pst134EA_013544 [Puccinia striiformis f. sp. tritici]KAI9612354.1 hypothetical protein KEM48_004085 [Puccinia striiformis f. sp. tritici PST-130]